MRKLLLDARMALFSELTLAAWRSFLTGNRSVMNFVGHSYPVSVAREKTQANALLTHSSSEEDSDQA